MLSESAVKKHIKNSCKAIGAFCDMPGASTYGKAGRSDFIIVFKGKVFFIETKKDIKRNLDPAQKGYRNEIRKHGGVYLIFNSENMHMIAKVLTCGFNARTR